MNPGDWSLLGLALLAIGGLVLLITRWKVNAFIALLLAALAVGAGAVFLGRTLNSGGREVPYTMAAVMRSFADGMGATLGGIAAIIGLGTMLGKLLAESGGAAVLARRFASWFGASRMTWCMVTLGLCVGLATWFAVGLLLLVPILLTLTRQTRQPFLHLALPLLSCLSVMHGLMPPHPGPVVAADALKVGMGLVLLWGAVIGVPLALLAGPVLARWVVPRVPAEAPAEPSETRGTRSGDPGAQAPGFLLTLFTILLPIVLMLVATAAELGLPAGNRARVAASFVGHPVSALLVSVLLASWSLGTRCGFTGAEVLKFTETSIGAVGMTLLVVGGGGGLARVLRDSGVADAIGRTAELAHLGPLVYGWLVAAFIRVATGSATVAITTASGLLVPVLAGHPEYTESHRALMVVALGCGSLFLSHLNDGGFWIVKDSLGLTVSQTLRSWTVCETVIGVAGLALVWMAFEGVSLFTR